MEIKISTEKFQELFFAQAKKYFEKENRTFILDEKNKRYYQNLCYYFSENDFFEKEKAIELRKGLFVYGSIGTGKTSSLKIIQKISLNYNLKNIWFYKRSAHEVVTEFNQSINKDNVIIKYSKGSFFIDDLGAENIASNYGKEDIFIRIIELRYEEFIKNGTKTHITTNLNPEQILDRYGVRVFDRLRLMFNFLSLEGRSRRY